MSIFIIFNFTKSLKILQLIMEIDLVTKYKEIFDKKILPILE